MMRGLNRIAWHGMGWSVGNRELTWKLCVCLWPGLGWFGLVWAGLGWFGLIWPVLADEAGPGSEAKHPLGLGVSELIVKKIHRFKLIGSEQIHTCSSEEIKQIPFSIPMINKVVSFLIHMDGAYEIFFLESKKLHLILRL